MAIAPTATLDPASLAPDALKSRFKQRCIATNNIHQNWQIRVHRAISWLKRAAQFSQDQPEAKLLFLWIGFNSLYSRWNAERNAPDQDSQARRDFLDRLCVWDGPLFTEVLRKSRGLARKLLSDPYLSDVFWKEPDHPKARGWATEDASFFDRNLAAGKAALVLNQTMQRVFVLRGQLVHGASTGGSRLNRGSLKYCLMILELLVPLFVHVTIEHGCHDEWPELCYPPVR